MFGCTSFDGTFLWCIGGCVVSSTQVLLLILFSGHPSILNVVNVHSKVISPPTTLFVYSRGRKAPRTSTRACESPPYTRSLIRIDKALLLYYCSPFLCIRRRATAVYDMYRRANMAVPLVTLVVSIVSPVPHLSSSWLSRLHITLIPSATHALRLTTP